MVRLEQIQPGIVAGILLSLTIFLLSNTLLSSAAFAAKTPDLPSAQKQNEPLPFNQDYADKIAAIQDKITAIDSDLKSDEKKDNVILEARLKQSHQQLVKQVFTELESIPEPNRSEFIQNINKAQSESFQRAWPLLETSLNRINELVMKEARSHSHKDDQEPAEQAIIDAKIQLLWKDLESNQTATLSSFELAEQFKVDISQQRDQFEKKISNNAEVLSAGLTLALQEVEALRKSLTIVPKNEDLKAKLSIAENRAGVFSHQLSTVIKVANSMGMDTTGYDQQIILATGQISSDIFDAKVIAGLLEQALEAMLSGALEYGPGILFNLLIFILILYIALKLSRLGKTLARTALNSAQVPLSNLLQKMIISMIGNGVLFLGILMALSQIGISLGPVLAGLGVVGFIIGFALQDSMSNFASGLMILFYRPFDIDDTIEAGGVLGKVKKMSLVNTTIRSFDNQTFVIPNNNIWQSTIKNLTEQKIRRVDLIFSIAYHDDINKAEQLLEDILSQNEKVLEHPESIVRLHELGDSSLNFVVRPWVKTDDYWEAYWAITKSVKMRFDQEGISIPFPQRDVHLFSAQTT